MTRDQPDFSDSESEEENNSDKGPIVNALADIVETITCPITSALCVRPVLADDGHVYEREAIQRWPAPVWVI